MKRILIIIFCFAFFIIGYTVSYVSQPATESALADCSSLSDDEQEFAYELSAIHRELFCQMFNEPQRLRAMTYASKSSAINPEDDGVEQVLKESRDQPEVSTRGQTTKNPCFKQKKS